jgi:Uma2 family endonuclease
MQILPSCGCSDLFFPIQEWHAGGISNAAGATIAAMDGDETMQSGHPDTRLTYDDFLLFPDDGRRHELIDGEHYVTPGPNTRHQRLVGRLYAAFAFYLRDHPDTGEAFLAPFDVVFSHFDVIEPDLLFVAANQSDIVSAKHVRGAPVVVIEILSRATRKVDEQIKRRLFERSGVREYWLVDPEIDSIKIHRSVGYGSFAPGDEISAASDDTLTTSLLPGFAVRLADLFR